MKNEELKTELGKHVKSLSNKDSSLSNAVFWEFVYEKVSSAVDDDMTKMYLINKYMIDVNLGGLRVIRDDKKINNEGDYYTITGAQHILSIKVPELPVYGQVFKTGINFNAEGGVGFTERLNVFDKFCATQKLSSKNKTEFKAYLTEKLEINKAVDQILNNDAMIKTSDYALRHTICFQAKWNGIENVKALLNNE